MKTTYLAKVNEALTVIDVPTPTPNENEVLIRLAFSSLNHRDVWIQQGKYGGRKTDLILGSDGFGTVESVGSAVTADWIGKEVIINPGLGWGDNPETMGADFKILGNPDNGTFAEYVCIDQQYVYPKPTNLTAEEAAALPLAGLTTFRAVFSRAKVKAGEKVLVTGIGAGTALLALAFAKTVGAEVYVTSSSQEKIEKAIALGASGGFNYKEEDWAEKAKAIGGFDVILDSASGKGFPKLISVAKSGGRIVFWGGTDGAIGDIIPAHIFWKNLSILGTTMGSQAEFKEMLAYVELHDIKPIVDKVFPSLNDAQVAFDYMATGQQFGKIVLTNQG